ncbi:hypothetical protein QTP88_014943 [Uroleucon formosanum]
MDIELLINEIEKLMSCTRIGIKKNNEWVSVANVENFQSKNQSEQKVIGKLLKTYNIMVNARSTYLYNICKYTMTFLKNSN